ncbi:MAG: DNA repair protein RecO [Bacteriovoracaceae bacterium]|nr:DNA repair protein RecO [Bacteroidota bacterium]
MIVETQAVVLRTMKYGDTSKIVTLYTRQYGKTKVIAKGARNQKSNKFGSSLEPMTVSSVVFYKKEQKDLHLLSKSEIVTPMSRMQDDPERMFAGLALVELINMVMHDEEENGLVFDMLVESLRVMNSSSKNAVNVFLSFIVKIFHQFGFGITIDACSRCGRTMEQHQFAYGLLRLSDGKFTCSICSEEAQQSGVRLSGGVLKSLLFFHGNSLDRSVSISLSASMRDELLAVLQSYLRYHIDGVRTLRSLSLLQTMS